MSKRIAGVSAGAALLLRKADANGCPSTGLNLGPTDLFGGGCGICDCCAGGFSELSSSAVLAS
jgi:hypothetical protein